MKKLRGFMFIFLLVMMCSLMDAKAVSYIKNPNVKSCTKASGGSCEFGGYDSPNKLEAGSQIQYNVNSTMSYNFVVLDDNNRVITMFYNGTVSPGNKEAIAGLLSVTNWDNVIDMSNDYREFSQSTGVSFSKRRIMTVDEANIFKTICGSDYIESSITCNVPSDKYYWIMDSTSLKYLSKQSTIDSPNGTAAYVLPVVKIYKFTEASTQNPGGSSSSGSDKNSNSNGGKDQNGGNGTSIDGSSANGTGTNGSQTVSVGDTLKNAYILYCIGTIVLVLGLVVFYRFYKKDKGKESKEEINTKKDE